MVVKKIRHKDGSVRLVLTGMSEGDMKHIYIRTSLSNSAIETAMAGGYGDKKLPKSDFGCAFAGIFEDLWTPKLKPLGE